MRLLLSCSLNHCYAIERLTTAPYTCCAIGVNCWQLRTNATGHDHGGHGCQHRGGDNLDRVPDLPPTWDIKSRVVSGRFTDKLRLRLTDGGWQTPRRPHYENHYTRAAAWAKRDGRRRLRPRNDSAVHGVRHVVVIVTTYAGILSALDSLEYQNAPLPSKVTRRLRQVGDEVVCEPAVAGDKHLWLGCLGISHDAYAIRIGSE